MMILDSYSYVLWNNTTPNQVAFVYGYCYTYDTKYLDYQQCHDFL
jgi:hypothetical protein